MVVSVHQMTVLSLFAPVFWVLSALTYFEFGWKIYKHRNLMSAVRSMLIHCNYLVWYITTPSFIDYFHWYELFISGVKLVFLFTVGLHMQIGLHFVFLSQFFCIGFQITFGIAQVVFLLPPDDPEFGLTIVMLVAVVVVCVLVHTLVRAIEYLALNIS